MNYANYYRKSSESEDRQVQSLESQKTEMMRIAQKNNLNVVMEYSESQSAKIPGRPEFLKMIDDIKSGKVNAILVWKLDRLARNMIEGGMIMELLTTGVLKEIRTYSNIHRSGDNILFMSVIFGMANQYSRDLSENVKRGYRTKLEKGEWPNKAPLGYRNDKNIKQLVVDTTESRFVRKAFEMYSTGNHSCKNIAEVLYRDGFRSKSGKKVSHSNIHLMLKKTFYYGVMESNGIFYKGKYKPLITKALFDTCQEARTSYKKAKPQKKKELHFSMRGIFECEVCGCKVTAEKQKGINYYHCTNGKKICNQKKSFIREDILEPELIAELQSMKFDDELIDILHDASLERFHSDTRDSKDIKKGLEKELQALRDEKRVLSRKLTKEVISDDDFKELSQELKLQIFDLERRIDESDVDIKKELATFELTRTAFKAFNINESEFKEKKNDEKLKFFKKLLSNSTLKHENGLKTLNLQYKKPYDRIAKASYTRLCPELLPD